MIYGHKEHRLSSNDTLLETVDTESISSMSWYVLTDILLHQNHQCFWAQQTVSDSLVKF